MEPIKTIRSWGKNLRWAGQIKEICSSRCEKHKIMVRSRHNWGQSFDLFAQADVIDQISGEVFGH